MSLPRFMIEGFLVPEAEGPLPLAADELHHFKVRRIEAGEHIACFNEAGHAWEVEVTHVDEDGASGIALSQIVESDLPQVTLVQGVSKGDRMTLSVRQATELGAERIIPYMAQRSIVRIKKGDEASKGERWRKVALAAAKQSGRAALPQVDDPINLKQLKAELAEYDSVVICWEEADVTESGSKASIGDALKGCTASSKVALVIGPEGGLAPAEVDALRELGSNIHVVTMGELILRTETASTVGLALCMYLLGGLGAN